MGKQSDTECLRDRFFQHVVKPSDDPFGCWLWIGARNPQGYGRFRFAIKFTGSYLAHRASYFLAHGTIPQDLSILHRCDNPPCVRPEHLFLGTRADNMEDARRKGRILCCVGAAPANAKLNMNTAKQIRTEYAQQPMSRVELGRRYGVHPFTITRILTGLTWRPDRIFRCNRGRRDRNL